MDGYYLVYILYMIEKSRTDIYLTDTQLDHLITIVLCKASNTNKISYLLKISVTITIPLTINQKSYTRTILEPSRIRVLPRILEELAIKSKFHHIAYFE